MAPRNRDDPQPRPGVFEKTRWLRITWRAHSTDRERERAVAEFCRIYWRPLFCVLSERGFNRADGEDLTQGFLLHFIESGALGRADERKGRFRDYVVSALDHYLLDQQARARTLKRGGGTIFLVLDDSTAEELDARIIRPPDHDVDLECDRWWFEELLGGVLDDLETDYTQNGRGRLFRVLKPHLTGDDPPPYWQLALRLRRSQVALRKEVERMRIQFREQLRDELRKRVGPECLEIEWENLRDFLRKKLKRRR